jgi:cell division protein FtsZ
MNQQDFDSISFDLPKNQSNVIKVIGVGGGGSNAIKHMFQQGIKGVDFVICNTDSQALEKSPVPNKVQLGVTLTEGLGAGANPEVGERAAQESIEDVRALLDTNTKMVFITAGMGGGTGTGAAPIIAKIARELDILTVGIVTTPFQFEGKVRNDQAQKGIEKFRENVDSLIIINNNKLREVYGNLGFKAGFSKADEVLATASKGIAEVITNHYTQNIDLRDAKTVLSNSGTAIMGSAQANGANRAQEGILKALDSPLLNDNKITGAKNVLLLIVSGTDEITIDEIGEINEYIQNEAGHSANIIMGVGEDDTLGDSIAITVIATGFDADQQNEISNTETKRIIHTLEEEQKTIKVLDDCENSNVTPGKLIMDIDEKPVEQKIKDSLTDDNGALDQPLLQKQPDDNGRIVHELSFDEEDEDDFNGLITKNPEEDSEVKIRLMDQSLSEPTKSEAQEPLSKQVEDTSVNDPYLLTFDLPDSNDFSTENLKEEEASKNTERKSIEFSPEILTDLENESPIEKNEEPEFKIVTKTVEAVTPEPPATIDVDPTDLPINEAIAARADERRRKMHLYNYKFKNAGKLDEMDKQPAYKRQGVELDHNVTDSKMSRTSLFTEDGEVKLRGGNNSFLHDNVD